MRKYFWYLNLIPFVAIFINAYLAQKMEIDIFKNYEETLFNFFSIILFFGGVILLYKSIKAIKNKESKRNWFWAITGLFSILFSTIGLYFNSLSFGF